MSSKRRNAKPYQIRGVNALFGDAEPSNLTKETQQLPLSQITLFAEQPRRYFDPQAMTSLVDSVKQHGILQPLLVRPLGNGEYQLIAGERRHRAATIAHLVDVPVVIRQMSDEEALQIALLENLQREDLNPIEETEGILQLLSLKLNKSQNEVIALLNQASHNDHSPADNVIRTPQWQQIEQTFTSIGRFTPESFRTNRLPLLNLPGDVLEVLRKGKIAYTKARLIARIKDSIQRQAVLKEAMVKGLSLSQIKERIAALPSSKPKRVDDLRSRMNTTFKLVKQSKALDDPKKRRRLEKLLTQLESLAEG